jgi:sugar O-acyltransferase (sialic acid O-acetyltransferase NeuD family)
MQTVIYGNGAMARVLFSYARHSMEIAGFTVDDAFCATERFCGLPLVPFSGIESVFDPMRYVMILAIGFIDMNLLRERKFQEATARGYRFTRYAHPSVLLHDDVIIAENTVILDHVSIHPGCHIGRGTFISSNVNIGHDCDIGDGNWINSGVAVGGGCRIGKCCVFGVNSSVAHSIRVGERNFIAANTLINRATKDDEVHLSNAGALFRLQSQQFLTFSRMNG